jgi:hypothetical protein
VRPRVAARRVPRVAARPALRGPADGLAALAGRLASSRSGRAGTAAELRDAARLMLVVDVLDPVAAVLGIVVVLKLTAMQGRKVLTGPLPAPALGRNPSAVTLLGRRTQ